MFKKLILLILSFSVVFLFSCGITTTTTISGHVYDASNGNAPLSGVHVEISEGDAYDEAYTDSNGYYSVTSTVEALNMVASNNILYTKDGYKSEIFGYSDGGVETKNVYMSRQ